MVKYLDTLERRLLRQSDAVIPDFFEPLFSHWHRNKAANGDAFPFYSTFDVTQMPRPLIGHLILCKLIGAPRRFFYEVVGQAIETHNGFPASKRFLADLPLKNKSVMAREFGLTVMRRCPIYSRGPYIGQYEYVKEIERLICPYRIKDETFAFVTLARFTLDQKGMAQENARVAYANGVGMHRPMLTRTGDDGAL